ncbi:uncharacterized protein METZ01_LOCUS241526, partial [marine metagenome]
VFNTKGINMLSEVKIYKPNKETNKLEHC